MNNLFVISSNYISSITENFAITLTGTQKKVALIGSAIFASVALFYLMKHYFFNSKKIVVQHPVNNQLPIQVSTASEHKAHVEPNPTLLPFEFNFPYVKTLGNWSTYLLQNIFYALYGQKDFFTPSEKRVLDPLLKEFADHIIKGKLNIVVLNNSHFISQIPSSESKEDCLLKGCYSEKKTLYFNEDLLNQFQTANYENQKKILNDVIAEIEKVNSFKPRIIWRQ